MSIRMDEPIKIDKYDDERYVYYYPDNGEIVLAANKPASKKLHYNPYWDNEKNFEFQRLAIRITGNCNMRCEYCFTEYHKYCGIIKEEYYKKSIEDFFAANKNDSTLGVILTGGEPLLYKNIIKDIAKKIKQCSIKYNKKFKISIYTNGTLIDDEYIEIFKDYNIHIITSVDGEENFHNKYRPMKNKDNAYQILLDKLTLMHKNNIWTTEVRSVIEKDETDLIKVINNNISLGFSRMHLIPIYGQKSRQVDKNYKSWIDAIKVYEKILLSGNNIEIIPFYNMYRKLALPNQFYTSYVPCDAGRRSITIGDDGNYHLCSHFVGSEDTCVGNYLYGIPNKDKIYNLINNCTSTICEKCWAKRLCGGACYHRAFLKKDPQNSDDCSNWRKVLKEIIMSYARIYNSNNKECLRFLYDNNTKLPDVIKRDIINKFSI
ncbi:radical SAM/SPASM domain-containing protein [Sarcina ventriculi]|uniref:radical SAM/SPASM domain-containing protein n=1 Tax=Sarcina ventriculi TaxID=1267 RepID=UPI0018A92167|nr:radical SAM protein [Sarcina ventriculi]